MFFKEDSFHLGVKGIIRNGEKKILLLNPKSESNYWDLPGGRIHKRESMIEALKREILEETGLKNITKATLFVMAMTRIRIPAHDGDVGLIFATYLCETEGDLSIHLSAEHTRFDWFDPPKAAELLAPNYPIEITQSLAKI